MVRVLTFTSGFDAVRLAPLLVVLSPSLVRFALGAGVVPCAGFRSRTVQCLWVVVSLGLGVAVWGRVLYVGSDVFKCVIYAT